jgi:membrane AbrB-like protein
MAVPNIFTASMSTKIVPGLLGFAVGLAGGALFWLLGAPLPWTLGSLAAAAAIAVLGVGWDLPSAARNVARPIIGVMAGSAFTADVVVSMRDWWQAIVPLIAFLVLITFAGRLFFIKFCGFDRTTAFFASTPGGLGELTLLGAQYGGSMRQLVLIHATRIVTVVFIVPFAVRLIVDLENTGRGAMIHRSGDALPALDLAILLGCAVAGYALGRPLKMINGVMVVPLVLSAIVHSTGLTQLPPPVWLVAMMQVVIGCVAGSRFAGVQWREVRTAVLQGFVWTLIMLLAALAAAGLCSRFVNASFAALLLAFAPGGVAEMTIIAFALGIEVAFVVCCHVVRSLFIVTGAPMLYRATLSRRRDE